ncbi:hypothetical protein [Capnocytophaga gingivalis]
MKAIVIYQAGDAHQLQVEERLIPTLQRIAYGARLYRHRSNAPYIRNCQRV